RLAVMVRICSISELFLSGPLPTASPSADSARRWARSARTDAKKLTRIAATQSPATTGGQSGAVEKLTAIHTPTANVADHSASNAETRRIRATEKPWSKQRAATLKRYG